MNNKTYIMNTAKFVNEITVIDPDNGNDVDLAIFKDKYSNGMFAIDISFLEQEFEDDEDPIIADPFNKGRAIKLIDL